MISRKRTFEVIEQSKDGDRLSFVYDIIMLVAITASIIPLMFIEDTRTFRIIEQITVAFYCRLLTSVDNS